MPQSSDETRALMGKWFGDEVSELGPARFLESRGYTLREDWCWDPPVPSHSISEEEKECVIFLIEEWDWGPVIRREARLENNGDGQRQSQRQ